MNDKKVELNGEEKDTQMAPHKFETDDQDDEIQVVMVIKGCAYDPLTRL